MNKRVLCGEFYNKGFDYARRGVPYEDALAYAQYLLATPAPRLSLFRAKFAAGYRNGRAAG